MVSICCGAYNHEKYIKDAIDSFLMQKTNFNYEIIINDDASIDSTADIIREYEKKYPNIIKPIYQKENQYSKHIPINVTFLYPKARGKYIAICDGDDYWCDENKLQMQVNFLEKNNNYSFSSHSSLCKNENKFVKRQSEVRGYTDNISFNIDKYFKDYENRNYKTLFQTSSIVFRKKYINNLIKEKPKFFYKTNTNIGDTNLILYLLLQGDGFYFDKYMSVYRVNVPGSWTIVEFSGNKKLSTIIDIKNIFINFDEYSNYKYIKIIHKITKYLDFEIILAKEKYKEALKSIYKDDFSKLSIRAKISIIAHAYFPKLMFRLKKYKEILYRKFNYER